MLGAARDAEVEHQLVVALIADEPFGLVMGARQQARVADLRAEFTTAWSRANPEKLRSWLT